MVSLRVAFKYLLLVLAFSVSSIVSAQAVEQKLTDSAHYTGSVDEWDSVSISGDFAIVGAAGVNTNGENSGAAYVFRRTGGAWVEDDTLIASDIVENDHFGHSVSISGDIAVIGGSGSAYVFRWDGEDWLEEQKLTASDGTESDSFGKSVSISGDVMIVGANLNDSQGNRGGAAYVFRWNGSAWTEEQKLTASDGEELETFGESVAMSDDVAIVGSPFLSSSAYVFRYDGSGWVEEQKLTSTSGGSSLGADVSISGDAAIVGDHTDGGSGGTNSGAAYIFRWDGVMWVQEQKLKPGDVAAIDWFGRSVSISGDVAVVGSLKDDDNGSDSGSAYIYRWIGGAWVQVEKLIACDGFALQNFGGSVFVDGNDVLVRGGASAYAYDLDPSTEPDIVVSGLMPSSGGAPPGGTVSVSFTMVNIGLTEASPSQTNLRLSTSPTEVTTDDPLLAEIQVPAIGECEYPEFQEDVTIPAGLTPGTYFLWAIVDVNGTAGQTPEGELNDEVNVPLVVTGDPPAQRFLTFPILGHGHSEELINSVMDHDIDRSLERTVAFTGEESRRAYGEHPDDDTLFKDRGSSPFSLFNMYTEWAGPEYLSYDQHTGIDYRDIDCYTTTCGANDGTMIVAAAAGQLTCVNNGYNMMVITHGNGYQTKYLHARLRYCDDADVEQGQVIGIVGAVSPPSQPVGPHLHFEVETELDNGQWPEVDPYGWHGEPPDPYSRAANTNLWLDWTPSIGLYVKPQSTEPIIEVPPGGGNVRFDIAISNHLTAQAVFDGWFETRRPDGSVRGPVNWTQPVILDPGEVNHLRGITRVPAGALAGIYSVSAHIETSPSPSLNISSLVSEYQDSFVFTKLDAPSERLEATGGHLEVEWGFELIDEESGVSYVSAISSGSDAISTPSSQVSNSRIPRESILYPVYPNPFSSSSLIRYDIVEAGPVSITVHDVLGREVARPVDSVMPPGRYEAIFDARQLSTGVYFVQMKSAHYQEARTITLLR